MPDPYVSADNRRLKAERKGMSPGCGCAIAAAAVLGFLPLVSVMEAARDTAPVLAHSPYIPLPKPTAAPKPSAPVAAPHAHQLCKWRGRGMFTSETFHVNADEWLLGYRTGPDEFPGFFAVDVCRADGTPVAMCGDVVGKDSAVNTIHEAGDFYLRVNSSQSWAVVVFGW